MDVSRERIPLLWITVGKTAFQQTRPSFEPLNKTHGWTIFLERTREGHRQSDKHWIRFKGNDEETSQRRGEAHMGFSERIIIYHLELDSTELN